MHFIADLEMDVNKAFFGARFAQRQQYIDSEVVRLMEPYTPKESGTLKDAPAKQTNFGSGLIIQNTPYAHRQYYTNKGQGLRGAKWFERMKAQHKKDILKGALER